MALPLKIKIRRGYIIAFLLLLFSYLIIFYIIRELNKETKWVFHSYDIINNLHSLQGEITDAETGVRGYIITKDIRFLKPYTAGIKAVDPQFQELRRLTNDNKSYKEKLDILEDLLTRRMKSLKEGIELFQKNGLVFTPDMAVNRESTKSAMDSIRLIVGQLMDEEKSLWKVRNDNLQSFFTTIKIITLVSLIIALLTASYSFFTFNRENKLKEEADHAANNYRVELEESVSTLKNVNQELQELKSIEKFASTGRIARTIAHEVRNPITNISLASEQLKELIPGNEDANILIDMIGRNASRINQLVSDLLDSTRFTQLNYTLVDINHLLDETLQLALDRIELSGVTVEKEYEKNMGHLNVDKERIKLAFLNVIVNAIEAMEKNKGILKIKTRHHNDKCIVEIKDNGSGMNNETVQNVFEPYFTTKPKGNGLGMTNTQNIILNHGGKIVVDSNPGSGSTFTIILDFEKISSEL